MDSKPRLTVFLGRGGQRDLAESIAAKTGAVISDAPGPGLTLTVDSEGVSLSGYGLSYRGDLSSMLPRITHGRLPHEALARAVKTDSGSPRAIDACAGMGEDALLIAACGYSVTMFERDPVIAALLRDSLRRAKKHPVLRDIVERMKLVDGDSIEHMPAMYGYDVIYLDPMFPESGKSGLVNKKLQLIRRLETPCSDGDSLLAAAYAAGPGKIIVKRPAKGPFLAGKKPDYSVSGKAVRFDFYLPGSAGGA